LRYIEPNEFILKRFEDSFGDEEKPSWRIAIMCFKGLGSSGVLIDKLNAVPVNRKVLSGTYIPGKRSHLYNGNINGNPIAVITGCWWGGPQAAIIVEELSCIGVNYIIGLGLAGSISRDLPKCTHIVASRGLTTDGTSIAYTEADSVNADDELLRVSSLSKQNLNIGVYPATIATVDAIYRETDVAVQEWASLGAQAINMETTPLYAASAMCNVKSLWIGYISDCLLDKEWEDWFDLPESLDHDSADIVIEIIKSLVTKYK
jgi:uridine phosphorylase